MAREILPVPNLVCNVQSNPNQMELRGISEIVRDTKKTLTHSRATFPKLRLIRDIFDILTASTGPCNFFIFRDIKKCNKQNFRYFEVESTGAVIFYCWILFF